MKQTNGIWYNRKAGGFGLALIILVAYIAIKSTKWGFTNISVIWSSLWFTAIVMSTLMTDLFENIESWIIHSWQIVENKALSELERIEMIKNQLEIAVDRYMVVFLKVNGFDSLARRILSDITKIFKGVLTVKELILIVSYALYDLVIRDGTLSFLSPYDVGVIFIGLVILKTIDAKAGIAELITDMHKEITEVKDPDGTLNKITGYIKELAHIYHIEMIAPTFDVSTLSEAEIKDLLLKIKQRQVSLA